MLVTLGDLAAAQTKATKSTLEARTKLLSYAATHSDATVHFHTSDMILHIHSDGSYLSAPKARSRAGGFFYLGDKVKDPSSTKSNGPVYIMTKMLRNIMASAAEAEVGSTFKNTRESIPMRTTLEEMGHP